MCDQILYKLQLTEKVESFLKDQEIIEKKITEFVAKMIRGFHFEEDEELLLVEECSIQDDINMTNSKISSSSYYTDN